jgi:hypothetical protein
MQLFDVAMIGSDRDQFLDAVRRVAAKDRDGFAGRTRLQ